LGRFQREARSAAKLHHTNIVPVFGIGEHDGLHYYVMQFIQGLGLDVVLNELRHLRQPRGKELTQGDTPGRPTNVPRELSAVDVARALLSGEFGQPEPAGDLTTAPGKPSSAMDEGGQQDASDSSFILHSSTFSSATIRLPGQSEASSLSESGNRYWQ